MIMFPPKESKLRRVRAGRGIGGTDGNAPGTVARECSIFRTRYIGGLFLQLGTSGSEMFEADYTITDGEGVT